MQAIEKEIGNRNVRLIYIDKHIYTKDYFLNKLMKLNIYFDYLVVSETLGMSQNEQEKYIQMISS